MFSRGWQGTRYGRFGSGVDRVSIDFLLAFYQIYLRAPLALKTYLDHWEALKPKGGYIRDSAVYEVDVLEERKLSAQLHWRDISIFW